MPRASQVITAPRPVARPEDDLKRLLLADELEQLSTVKKRTDILWKRVGDDPALRESVRRQIVEVLREAGIRDYDRLSSVLAPLVMATLREEIRNSRDLMVDALYPITGRLVAAAVRNAMKNLMATIEEKLDSTLSFDRWKIRVQARLTGRSETELLLSRYPPFKIEEIYLIHRPAGLVVAHSSAEAGGLPDLDSDLVGGMLSAIMTFAKDTFKDGKDSELRTLEFGDSELFLQSSPAFVLAVKTNGPAPSRFAQLVEETFWGFLETWGETLAKFDGALADEDKLLLDSDLRHRFGKLIDADRKGYSKARSYKGLVVALILLLGLGYWAYDAWSDGRRDGRIRDAATAVIEDRKALDGYPIRVTYDGDSKELKVVGLLPNAAEQAYLKQALAKAAPGARLNLRFGVLPKIPPPQKLPPPKIIVRQVPVPVPKIVAPPLKPPTPAERLDRWVRSNAIFFGDGETFGDPAAARAQLTALAGLLAKSPNLIRLRIVGYTDRSGSARVNRRVSLKRANRIADALVELGVPRDRLIVAGRAYEKMLSTGRAEAKINRRVEFEVVRIARLGSP